jgi:hypothetical protein
VRFDGRQGFGVLSGREQGWRLLTAALRLFVLLECVASNLPTRLVFPGVRRRTNASKQHKICPPERDALALTNIAVSLILNAVYLLKQPGALYRTELMNWRGSFGPV